MTSAPQFRCCVCEEPAFNPYLCFDRRVERWSKVVHGGKLVPSCNIAARETLLTYCSHGCWQAHQADVAASLELQQTYPASSSLTPCCRCGKSVNRRHLYVNYSISEMTIEGEDVLVGHCIDDHDFAVLCRDCEHPDLPSAEADSSVEEKEEVLA